MVAATLALYLEPLLVSHRIEDGGDEVRLNPASSLVPLLGTLRLRHPAPDSPGGSREPDARYTLQAVLLEVCLGGIFVGLGLHFHNDTRLALACLYTALLLQITLIDFHYRLVLNALSYPGAVLAIIGSLFWSGIGLGSALLGGAVALAAFLAIEIVGRGAMGRGDTKLAGLIGLMRGFPGSIAALIVGVFAGGIMAAGLLLTGKGRTHTFAYGPALAIGAVVSFFIGRH